MKKIIFVFIILPFYSYAQIITTYAGNGIPGGIGDTDLAIYAELSHPIGVIFDNNGNLLICQSGAVRKVNTLTGIIYTIAGKYPPVIGIGDGGPADSALVDMPYFVCVDAIGNLYISDYWAIEVRKVEIATGIINDYVGTALHGGSTGDGGLADTAKLASPGAVCVDTVRKVLYVSDAYSHKIRAVNMVTGIITTFAGTGVNGFSGDGGLADTAKFSRVLGLAIDNYGNLYIGDWDNGRIRKVDIATGIVTTIAGNGTEGYGGDSGIATDAMINKPVALCFDNCGNLIFADEMNNRIRKIDAITGIITTIAGNGTAGFSGDSSIATAAELNNPDGVCFDNLGNLYISDYYNQRVRKVTFPYTAITLSNTLTISPADTVCSATEVTFTASVIASSGTITYQWYVNGSMVSTSGSGYTYTPTNGDSIRCVATATNPCTSAMISSNTIYMVVNPYNVPTITIAAPASALVGSTVTVNATVTGAGSSYHINWYDNGGLFNTTTVPVVTYVKGAGVDVITATVVPGSEGGCYDSTTSSAVSVAVSNAGITSPQPSSGERVAVYPNPVSDMVHVDGDVVSYKMMSVVGAVLLRGDLRSGGNSIDVSGFAPGVYVLEVMGSDGGKIISKIVKD